MIAHADSGFSPERSDGCRYMMMNGAVTSGTAKQHPTVDDSSTLAEITECKYAADDVVTFRGFLGELGFDSQSKLSILMYKLGRTVLRANHFLEPREQIECVVQGSK